MNHLVTLVVVLCACVMVGLLFIAAARFMADHGRSERVRQFANSMFDTPNNPSENGRTSVSTPTSRPQGGPMTTLSKPQYAPVGALVYNAYWREQYRVLSHNDDGTITVRWETGPSSGLVNTHRTAFDWGRDRILGNVGVVKCSECSDTDACGEHQDRKVWCDRCVGTGSFITHIDNGVPKGPGGACYRCNGKGYHTSVDRKRNAGYERVGHRY